MKYIDSEKLIAEINNRIMSVNLEELGNFGCHRIWAYNDVKDLITSLQQEQPEVEKEVEFICINKRVKMTIQELINYYIDTECAETADECGF